MSAKPRSLNDWFLHNTKLPLIVLASGVAVVQICFLAFTYYQKQKSQEKAINQLVANIATLGIEQSNRPLIESAFQLAMDEFRVNSVLVCKRGATFYAHPFNTTCGSLPAESFAEARLNIQPVGLNDYQFIFYVDRLHFDPIFLGLNGLVFVLLIFVALIISRVQRRLSQEIFGPLKNHLTSDEPLEINELVELRRKIEEYQKSKAQQAVATAILEHNCRIGHNVKSLKQTVDSILEDEFTSTRQEKRIRNLSRDIISIMGKVEEAMPSRKTQAELVSEESFFDHMKSVNLSSTKIDISNFLAVSLDQKRTELKKTFPAVKLTMSAKSRLSGRFIEGVTSELRSIFSNLINNSVQAGATNIHLVVRITENKLYCQLEDNGSGVPKEESSCIFNRGASFSKNNGTGYGLFHAKSFIESWGGQIGFESFEVEPQTVFTIELPIWQLPDLNLSSKKRIVVLDDEEIVHEKWRELFKKDQIQTEVLSFLNTNDFYSWFDSVHDFQGTFFFIDHDLGKNSQFGEDIISELGISSMSVVVSNNYDSSALQLRCSELEVPLVPKTAIV